MPDPTRTDPRVDRILGRMEPEQREIASALRASVLEVGRSLRETVLMGVPTYVGQGRVLYIADYTDHVNLGFYYGAHLKDTSGFLEGTGKNLRHVKVRRADEARARALKALIREAVSYDAR